MDYCPDNKRIIANNLRYLLREKNTDRRTLCRDLDLKYTTFCDWYNAKTYPRIESLDKLARYFGIEVCDFFVDLESPDHFTEERVLSYVSHFQELDVATAERLTDEQLKILIRGGTRIKRKSLEDYINDSASKSLVVSADNNWGTPVEGETW